MSATATARHEYDTHTPFTPSETRPHTVRYHNALALYWSRRMTPIDGEGKTIGHQAASYLSTLLAWADNQFLMTSLHRGDPLSLPNATHHELCGHSPRQCLRLRKVLERHGLIRVQPGSFNYGASYSAKFVIEFRNILGPAEPALLAEQRGWRKSARRESDSPWTESPGSALSARTVSPAIEPTVLPRYPRSVEIGEEPPQNERSPETPESSPEAPERPVQATEAPSDTVPASPATPKPEAATPTPPPSVDPDDLTSAAGCVRTWQESSKCPRRRRGDLENAIRSEGDAQTVRLIASLVRDGVPERVLVKAFTECLAAYSPDLDPKYRSPYIQSLVWFQGWVENAVESLNYSLRRVLKTRGSLPSDQAIVKLLYLAVQRASKKWTRPVQNWKEALNRFAIMFGDRMPAT